MTRDPIPVISRYVANRTCPHKGHGPPGCEPGQGATLLCLLAALDRSWIDPGAALFELPALCPRASSDIPVTSEGSLPLRRLPRLRP
jgi:hypothetical protein